MTLRAPVFQAYNAPDWTRAVNALSQGLNPNLAGGGVEPFYQLDWPNPRGPAFPVENRTWLQALNLSLQKPFAQTDWPNPRGYPFPAENRGYLWPGNALIGGGVQPFSQTDWPNPRGPQFPQENRGYLWQGNALLGSGASPFAQTDWPNPRGYPFPTESRTFLWPGNALIGVGNLPIPLPLGVPYDWPNPIPYAFPVENRTFLSQVFNLPVAPPPPPVDLVIPAGGPGDDDTPKRKKQRYGKVGNKYVPFADWQELALLRAENRKRVDAAEAAKAGREPLLAAQDAGPVAPLTPQGLPRDATAFAALIPPATAEALSGAPEIGLSADPTGIEAQALAIREAAQAELRKRRRREEDAVALLMVH